jgi:hypothetical protein
MERLLTEVERIAEIQQRHLGVHAGKLAHG